MPIIRKIILIGNSKAITIPKSWLEFYERETGKKIERVTIEVNEKLIIEPYLKKEVKQ